MIYTTLTLTMETLEKLKELTETMKTHATNTHPLVSAEMFLGMQEFLGELNDRIRLPEEKGDIKSWYKFSIVSEEGIKEMMNLTGLMDEYRETFYVISSFLCYCYEYIHEAHYGDYYVNDVIYMLDVETILNLKGDIMDVMEVALEDLTYTYEEELQDDKINIILNSDD